MISSVPLPYEPGYLISSRSDGTIEFLADEEFETYGNTFKHLTIIDIEGDMYQYDKSIWDVLRIDYPSGYEPGDDVSLRISFD